jgi:hypothetical protein
VFGFLKGGLLPVHADLGIALAVGDTSHRQIHTHLGALTIEVGAQIHHDILGRAPGNAQNVLGSPGSLAGLLVELGTGRAALWALFRCGITLVDITANGADKLFHDLNSS